MKLFKIENGILRENCYICGDDEYCYVIDPGSSFNATDRIISANYKGIKAILLTHGHFDHVGLVDKLVEKYHCKVYMSPKDIDQIDGTYKNHPFHGKLSCTLKTKTIDCLLLDDDNIIVYETPGHTIGSVCYYFKKEKILFSGDTLFQGSIGRTDLVTSSKSMMIKSLELLMSLDDDVKVYPGHENSTTIGIERYENEFIRY